MIRAILTDIEGTTTSIDFVKETLFPYAARHLEAFLRQHETQEEVLKILHAVDAWVGRSLSPEQRLNTLQDWIAEDLKATPLKALQGLIWEEGYRSGRLQGHLYPDAAEWLKRWHQRGLALFVFSSGSIKAQKLLFGHTAEGDLTDRFKGFFDTTTGPKNEASAYRSIVAQIGLPAEEILFLSDVTAELDAAAEAGILTLCLVREGRPLSRGIHQEVRDFKAVDAFLINNPEETIHQSK